MTSYQKFIDHAMVLKCHIFDNACEGKQGREAPSGESDRKQASSTCVARTEETDFWSNEINVTKKCHMTDMKHQKDHGEEVRKYSIITGNRCH